MKLCPYCDWPLLTDAELKTHIEIKHPDVTPTSLPPIPERQPMPKILAIHSTVMVCASCGAWYMRLPEYLSDDGTFDECNKCGNTSFKVRRGRPYGPKSKEWPRLIAELTELWRHVSVYEYECFVTDPPLPNGWEWPTDAKS